MAEPYIATEALYVGSARAHNPGDVVPDDNVKQNNWQDSVARAGTKAANEAQGVTESQPVSAQAPAPK